LKNSQRVVTPAKAGVWAFLKSLETLDSGPFDKLRVPSLSRDFRRNDRKGRLPVFYERINVDELVRSPKLPFPVIPVKTGIQEFHVLLDSRLRGSDDLGDFLRTHQC
jgi:hypothetical protein